MAGTRLTWAEESAILTALAYALASPLDGYDDEEEADRVVAHMKSAQAKLWEREEARQARLLAKW